jgi:bifunctional DNA-binding transcriptional regulator/antitoxin component of YhaV-PrlF toxin-antitoxin module
MDTPFFQLDIDNARRVVLPEELCDDLGLQIGGTVFIRVEAGTATLSSVEQTIRRFQELTRRQLPEGLGLVDQLIAEREAASRDE